MSNVYTDIVNCGVCGSVNGRMGGIFSDLGESFKTSKVIKDSPGKKLVKESQEKVHVETSNTGLLVQPNHIDDDR